MLTSLFRLFYVTAECTGSYKENEANILFHIFFVFRQSNHKMFSSV